MKKYEITFIVGENFTEDKAKEIAKNVRQLIESKGGKVEVDLFWGKKKLFYKIAKNTFGYYFVFVFFTEPVTINELNKEIGLNEKIIRYLMVDFVEKTPFFEEVAERKNKLTARVSDDVIEENIQKEKASRARKPKEEVVKKKEVEEPQETIEEVVVIEEPKEEIVEEIRTAEPEVKEEKPEVAKPVVEEIVEAPVEVKEEVAEPKIEEKKSEVKKEEPKEEVIERKPERKKMTDDERKEQLEKKLAELLKEEEEV